MTDMMELLKELESIGRTLERIETRLDQGLRNLNSDLWKMHNTQTRKLDRIVDLHRDLIKTMSTP